MAPWLTRWLPLLPARVQPVDDHLAGPAFDLAEQPLPAGQVDKADVPAVRHGLPCLSLFVEAPSWSAAAGLIDPQHRHRLGLVRQDPGGIR